MKFPNFVGPTYRSQSPLADGEECFNWYMERMESEGASVERALYPAPGFELFAAIPKGGCRALLEDEGRAWTLIGGQLEELFETRVVTDRGAVMLTDNNPGTLVTNGVAAPDGELMITTGGRVYILNLTTNVVATPTAGGLPIGATMGGMLDAYFLVLDAVTGQFKISPLNGGLVWDITQSATRSIAPDPWKALLVGLREVWLFGGKTTEVWYDAGAYPFPMAPVPGAFMKYGIAAPFSAKYLKDSAIWLATTPDGSREVVKAQGYSPIRISTHAVEYALSRYARVDDAIASTYQDQGHSFYLLHFPSANATWVFDLTTNAWHRRGTWNLAQARFDAQRAQYHAYAFNQHLVGDAATGSIHHMDVALGLDVDGGPLRRVRAAPNLNNELRRVPTQEFQLHLEPGLGLAVGQGSDPQVMLRISRNGGKTFGNIRTRGAGKMGEYKKRVIWRRCGAGRNTVFEIAVSDPIPWRILGAFLKIRATSAAAPEAA